MSHRHAAPYGTWKSPIDAARAVAAGVDLRHALGAFPFDGSDVYWLEGRPAENGRRAIIRRSPDGRLTDVLPAACSARTRVHEYGGGDFIVHAGVIYFANDDDQRIYALPADGVPVALTPTADARYADMVVDERRQRLLCVREDHTNRSSEPLNAIVSIDLTAAAESQAIISGNDFYASPRLSPDGRRIAWLSWNHPNMPWDGSDMWVAELAADGTLGSPLHIAGGAEESIFQPEWSPDGTLYFVSDRSGWWNLYRWRDEHVDPVCEMAAEFGVPQWSLCASTYAFTSSQRIVCAYAQHGTWRLGYLDPDSRTLESIPTPYTDITQVRATAGRALFCAAGPTAFRSIVELDVVRGSQTILRQAQNTSIASDAISVPEAITYPTTAGQNAHAFFYAPANREFTAPVGERPPLLLISHGGPTGAASAALELKTQYWTSRGFAVLDVNYRGSTGYGRAYRTLLDGQWGVADVEDCVNAARHMVASGRVDPRRLLIRGSSAGGYTTLCALTFHDMFRAGAIYYGISDLEALATDTHKFEAHYLDRLVGPYPQLRELYRQRSPIHFIDRLSCPLIVFQGLEDPVVPPSQAERMVAALREKGLPVAYVAFAGEAHGFRRADTACRALEAELYFYARVLGIELAEPLAPVAIDNL